MYTHVYTCTHPCMHMCANICTQASGWEDIFPVLRLASLMFSHVFWKASRSKIRENIYQLLLPVSAEPPVFVHSSLQSLLFWPGLLVCSSFLSASTQLCLFAEEPTEVSSFPTIASLPSVWAVKTKLLLTLKISGFHQNNHLFLPQCLQADKNHFLISFFLPRDGSDKLSHHGWGIRPLLSPWHSALFLKR